MELFLLNKKDKGFTLIELLIVIAILAVLAVAVVVVLNPAELLKQARDSNRISDLASIDKALNLYFYDVAPTSFTATTTCTVGTSFPGLGVSTCAANSSASTTGSGWVPVDLEDISSGSPLPRLPVDPVNNSDNYYAIKISSTVGKFEINANMESTKYSNGGSSDAESTDGGNMSTWYEVGTNINQTWTNP
jgi:prepilin-type N-terminal cleavage/methylation domain-containing protein